MSFSFGRAVEDVGGENERGDGSGSVRETVNGDAVMAFSAAWEVSNMANAVRPRVGVRIW